METSEYQKFRLENLNRLGLNESFNIGVNPFGTLVTEREQSDNVNFQKAQHSKSLTPVHISNRMKTLEQYQELQDKYTILLKKYQSSQVQLDRQESQLKALRQQLGEKSQKERDTKQQLKLWVRKAKGNLMI